MPAVTLHKSLKIGHARTPVPLSLRVWDRSRRAREALTVLRRVLRVVRAGHSICEAVCDGTVAGWHARQAIMAALGCESLPVWETRRHTKREKVAAVLAAIEEMEAEVARWAPEAEVAQ